MSYYLSMASRGEIFSTRADSENRTYFFNVKENRRGDIFLNIVESSKKDEGETFDRHQIMVFEEDILPFMTELQKAAGIVLKKDELNKKSAPQKFKKKAVPSAVRPKPQVKGSAKPVGKQPVKPAGVQPNATNLRRKKVSLKLKKKREDDQ